MLLLAAIAVMLAAVASCARPGTIYHHYVSVDDDGWDTCSYAVFTFDIDSAMSGETIDIDIELRLRPTYSFANLWLEASDNASVPADYAADTLQLRTADDAGVRAGTFAAGLYSLSLPYKHIESVRPGTIGIRLRHLMGQSPLPGVKDVGIRVVKAGAGD